MSKRLMIIVISIYTLVVAGLISGLLYINHLANNTSPVEFIQTESVSESHNEKLVVTITKSKEWAEPGSKRAAQYDATIYNKTSTEYVDWEVTIPIPNKSYLSDSWSFNANITDDTVYATCVDYNVELLSEQPTTFGFILIGRNLGELTDIKITATPQYTLSDFKSFKVLLTLLIITLVSGIVFLIVRIQVYKYRKKAFTDEKILEQALRTFVNFIDAKDKYTRGHSVRVALYSKELAKKIGMNEEEVEKVYYAALLHDVGKITIPDSILGKQGALTPEERKIIETHTTNGKTIFNEFNALDGVLDAIMYHHERYDGKGYPEGLVGEQIPLIARIICVADSYDAMSSDRCYRPRLSRDVIEFELRSNAGNQFDPILAKHMLELLDDSKIIEINKHIGN